MISKTNFTSRRKRLLELTSQDIIVLTGSDLVQKSSDETYEFEQDGYFYYLTGIDEPGWMLVIDRESGKEFLISTDESSYHSEVWEVKLSDDEAMHISGIPEVLHRRDGWGYLRNVLPRYKDIGTIIPHERFSKSYGMFLNPAKVMLIERLKRLHANCELVDIGAQIRELRAVKDADEIAEIREALRITKDGFELIRSQLQTYTNEADIFADMTHTFLKAQTDFGYRPVIASGKNASAIHYKLNKSPIRQNAFLLIDAGAKSGAYTADITRTYEIGSVSEFEKDIFKAVEFALHESLQFLKPGMSMIDHEVFAEETVGRQLMRLGITDNMLRKSIRTYFPHAIGHHLGIDVHDPAPYDKPLQPGAVITVEPGIYLPEKAIGVRIEENVLITDTGIELLSKGIR